MKEIPLHYPVSNNDIFIVMPDHFHAIFDIPKSGLAGLKPATTRSFSLSEIVRTIKTFSVRRINQLRNTQGGHVRQPVCYEHMIQSEKILYQTGEHISGNPQNWEADRENPYSLKKEKPLPFEY
ncbi:MAG: hypothetical protein JXA46_10655 [Dehalococcoidales bacterium]|nr:hypothetical protein [Dehalococcoidales bacterium]